MFLRRFHAQKGKNIIANYVPFFIMSRISVDLATFTVPIYASLYNAKRDVPTVITAQSLIIWLNKCIKRRNIKLNFVGRFLTMLTSVTLSNFVLSLIPKRKSRLNLYKITNTIMTFTYTTLRQAVALTSFNLIVQ